jgi:hypothetical protein
VSAFSSHLKSSSQRIAEGLTFHNPRRQLSAVSFQLFVLANMNIRSPPGGASSMKNLVCAL